MLPNCAVKKCIYNVNYCRKTYQLFSSILKDFVIKLVTSYKIPQERKEKILLLVQWLTTAIEILRNGFAQN